MSRTCIGLKIQCKTMSKTWHRVDG
ncbi:hypothetical protein F383_26992 [Gossypium arboreum]|uniref:Uncharacterized protein n=1 Tax=Gossypium arboreum TaxID=29729 RepID=A0A0B0PBH4_GOSAR|nr:hypothetical protein F383_26992 [Gossypium arboreum]